MSISDFASAAQIGMPGVVSPGTPGSLASTAASAGMGYLSGVSEFRHLGLAMRFKVEVAAAGVVKLGNWTSCDGLKVEFKYEPVRSGGEYDDVHVLPLTISYGPVTLKRAVEPLYSTAVQDWLKTVAMEWQQGTGEAMLGKPVTITLFDVYQKVEKPAATWTLQNAFPISWSGPSMSAKSNEIATETLVLEHSGFLKQA
jgi:phage tail-like protein